MKKSLAIALVAAFVLGIVALAGATTNPCGNHGNNCCTEDGGQSYGSVATTCAQAVTANPKAYCDSYVEAEANARATAICGDCRSLSLFAAITNTKAACQASQENSNAAASYCGSAEQTCGDVSTTLSCPPAPACPDIQPVCAQWKYRYDAKGHLAAQKCKRWVVPVVQ